MGAKRAARGGKPSRARGGETNELATNAFQEAARRMREAGFDVGDGIEIAVDPRLPIMGYTMPGQGGGFRITVSGGALRSGMLEGLIVHEMSHIYRMLTKHPSHDPRIIGEAMTDAGNGAITKDYQRKILHDLVNNVEDLYADDISFRVIREAGILTPAQATEFLQGWVEDTPAESRDGERARWANAWLLANNARAIAQMARHRVEDTGGLAAAANERLLSRMDPAARGHFDYLRELLANLEEEITDREYRELLDDYLGRFLELVAA